MTIQAEFGWYQTVYLITDKEQMPRTVVEIIVNPGNVIKYGLNCGTTYSIHYAGEISTEKDVLTSLT